MKVEDQEPALMKVWKVLEKKGTVVRMEFKGKTSGAVFHRVRY